MSVGGLARPRRERLLAGWAFSESLSWPLLPDMIIGALAADTSTRDALRLAGAATVGSAAGALVHHRLAARGRSLPMPLTTPRMTAAVDEWLADRGFVGFAHQPLSGVPHKVFAARAHAHGLGGLQVVAATLAFRGPRFAATALGAVAARSLAARALAPVTARAPAVARRVVAAGSVAGFSLALAGMLKRWR